MDPTRCDCTDCLLRRAIERLSAENERLRAKVDELEHRLLGANEGAKSLRLENQALHRCVRVSEVTVVSGDVMVAEEHQRQHEHAALLIVSSWSPDARAYWEKTGKKLCPKCGDPWVPCEKGPNADEPGFVGFYPCTCGDKR